ncbi:MAG: septum formation inhibitor Maf [Deltaproteobacteria bacterium]|nr:MAG: septum formation inhibitor Maf [Deltaproteobacteria bacterium]
MKRDLILASSSPRRQEMLRVLGIAFEIHPAEIEEIPFHGEEPAAFAARMARQKAQAVARVHPDAVVIGADTVVVLEGRILGKPVDAADAVRMLKALRGQEHKVMTGFSVIVREAGIERNRVITSTVFVRRLTDREIEGYVATGEPLDKAGAYAIQGIGAFLVEGIVGSYTNIVGLPLSELLDELEAIGAVRLFDQEG